METKKILVTGSSGTIGTRLCEKLIKKGYDIICVDLKPNKWNNEINKLTIIGDLCDKATLIKLPTNFDLIIHLAANAHLYDVIKNPSKAMDNFEMLFNILEFTRTNHIKRLVFSSSREVYGNSKKIICSENDILLSNCSSPYAASKLGGEALIQAYQKCYNIDFVILRFSNVYGMYDESDRVIPSFISLCKAGKDLIVFGKEKILDFTYIDDVVSGVILCIENFECIKNETFNIAYGKGTLIFELAKLIKKYLKKDGEIIIKDNRIGEIEKYTASISKAKQKIDYTPKIGLNKGIKKTIEWYGR